MPPDRQYAADVLPQRPEHCLIDHPRAAGHQLSLLYFKGKPSASPASSSAGEGESGTGSRNLTLLFSHGNAEDLGHSYSQLQNWHRRLGVDLVAYDYRGYGLSSGKCTEKHSFQDAEAVLSHMQTVWNIPRREIVLVGRSLGSGPTTELASKHRGLGGLVLISPLATAATVAGSFARYSLYPFDIMANVRKIHKVIDYPILIFHGDKDEVVPFAHGQELYEIARKANQATYNCWLPGCGHNDIEIRQPILFFEEFAKHLEVCKSFTPPTLPAPEASCFSSLRSTS